MNKTKIEWVKNPDGTQGFTSNPISGLCPVACWYCYGKKIYKRKLNKYFDERLMLWPHRLAKIQKRKKPVGIFMCSTFELFHPCTKGFYRDNIFHTIKACPQHRFYVLTKFPQNIDRPMPPNVWLGVTVTKQNEIWKLQELIKVKANIHFISFEPLLERIKIDGFALEFEMLDWIIIGKLTQYGNKHDPKLTDLEWLINPAQYYQIPIFLKNNLKNIWGEPLIQEMPE